MPNRSSSTTISDQQRRKSAQTWLIATAAQAFLTCVLLLAARQFSGKQWAGHFQIIAVLGITATWSLALRTIRARLIELLDFWSKASFKLLDQASKSGRHFLNGARKPSCDEYVKISINRLRIIAAGLTIPFFLLPLLWTFICVFLSVKDTRHGAEYWLPLASSMLLVAAIVAGYFHWSIVPLPQPVRVSIAPRGPWRKRIR